MTEVLVIMTSGILLGFVLRSKVRFIKVINSMTIWIIFTLLFFMGISVGSNVEIMNNITTLGMQGLILALVAILGSVLLSWIVYNIFFKS